MQDKPVIIQGNGTLLLDLHHPESKDARNLLMQFCELEKSPEHVHTYQLTPLSLWNAASASLTPEEVLRYLESMSRYEIAPNIAVMVTEIMGRYGLLELQRGETGSLRLAVKKPEIWQQLSHNRRLLKYLIPEEPNKSFTLQSLNRGAVKVELIRQGFPVVDLAPVVKGAELNFRLRKVRVRGGKRFEPRRYQKDAVSAFLGRNSAGSGFGSIVLPCGSGKTVIGILVMEKLQMETLILTPNVTSLHQWVGELLDKTDLTRADIAEYSGNQKTIGPVTVATYQVLTRRSRKQESGEAEFPHFALFRQRKWGLIIYDEVHILPAPVFRIVAEVQSVRRLGLTATLIREDKEEDAVFSLVGPKRYDVPWKDLENSGWIATALCSEVRVELAGRELLEYAVATPRKKIGIAAQNSAKLQVVSDLLDLHKQDWVLIIGQYIDQLKTFAKFFNAPLVTGKTSNAQREILYQQLRDGEISLLIVSKVANFAVDLPDVNVAIQVSGSFGSRQEEAQRLGRILRPKKKNAYFYSVVSRYTVEEEFALNRQKFLIEQGYQYQIRVYEEIDGGKLGNGKVER